MSKCRWFALVGVLCCVSIAAAQLDTSSWPSAGAGRACRESVTGVTNVGDGLGVAWNLTGLGAEPAGTGGGVLSSDGFLWFRYNGAGNFCKVNKATGQLVWSTPLGAAFRSAPLVTADKVFVSAGDGTPDGTATTAGVMVYDRTTATPTLVKKMENATVNVAVRSIQMGSVAYSGNLRLYTGGRTGSAGVMSAWDPAATPGSEFKWRVDLSGITNSGLAQVGPLWVDQATGKQMIALLVGNGNKGTVYLVRDDDTTGTVVASSQLSNGGATVNGQGALSQDGQRIYYNSDAGGTPLIAVSTTTAAVVWAVPAAEIPGINAYVPNVAVIGDRVYITGGGGNIACVKDNMDGTYAVQWVLNVGETGEFTSISAAKDTANRTYVYASNQTSHKLYRVEDLGSSAAVLATVDFKDSASWGGISTAIDTDGAIYQFASTAGGVFKFVPAVPPVADAGDDFTATCYGTVNLDGSGSHAEGGATIVNYEWKLGGTVIYSGPNATATTTLPTCEGTFAITLTVSDSLGAVASDTVIVTVGPYPTSPVQFSNVIGPGSGSFATAMATDGTYLYYLNHDSGAFYRTLGGTCNVTWETLPSAPGTRKDILSGSLAYTPGFEDDPARPSLITYRLPAGGGDNEVAHVFDIGTMTWTPYAGWFLGNSGYVVVGNRLYGNNHAWDTNLGGSFGTLLLNKTNMPTDASDWVTEGLNAWLCYHSSIRNTFSAYPNSNWFSRTVQQCVVNNSEGTRVYGIKTDQIVGLSDGDRFYKWDPALFVPPAANHKIGTGWYDWQTNTGFLGTDLGRVPRDIGYGSALATLPAGWKGLIGTAGGVFVIFGRPGGGTEGWGTPNNEYGIYDIESAHWMLGTLPAYSSSGPSAACLNGEVYIKQGASSESDPDANHTNIFWTSTAPPPPPAMDAGGPYTKAGVGCGTQQVPVAASATGNIVSWTWTEGMNVVGTGQTGPLTLLPGHHVVTLTVITDDCAIATDTADVTVTSPDVQSLPIFVTLEDSHDVGYGDSVTQADLNLPNFTTGEAPALFFGMDGMGNAAPVTTLLPQGGQWWFGPWVVLPNACYGAADLSTPDTIVRFDATYFQDANNWNTESGIEPFEDEAIFVSFRDANGYYASVGIVYGPDMRTDPDKWPNYKTVESYLDVTSDDMTQAGFDLSKVVNVEFHGTDWGGMNYDWISLKNLYIGPGDPRGACCLADFSCQYVSEAQCAELSGVYQGNGIACTPTLCLPPTGACCVGTTCSVVSAADCAAGGGTYQGDNTSCTPSPCNVLCPGDGNCDGVINWRDIDYLVAAQNDNVSSWTAKFPGTPPCDFLNLDTNGDSHVNWRDIDPFIALMNTTCP